MNPVAILLQATAIMLTLVVLRPLLKAVLSARARCALWILPALRLLLPVQIRSPFSLMTPAQTVSTGVEAAAGVPVVEIPAVWLGSGIGLSGDGAAAVVEQASPASVTLGDLLLVVWLAGALITGAVILWQNARFYAALRRLARPVGRSGGLPVCLVEGLPTPCLAGLFRPKIYLNERAMGEQDVLQMTLRHELTHYKRRDHLWNGLRGLLLALYWFHPLVWICSELFRQDCETACDEEATRGMDGAQRERYGMALITLASRGGGRLVCLSTVSSGKKLLKERITALAKARTFRWAAVAALLLAVVLCLTMCTMPEKDETGPVEETAGPVEETAGPVEETAGPVEETAGPENDLPAEAPAVELLPQLGEAGTMTDLAWFLELSLPGKSFLPMEDEEMDRLLSDYGDLLDGYILMGRVSTDGGVSYVVGEYPADPADSPLYGLYSVEVYDGRGENPTQLLYREEDDAEVEQALSSWKTPSVGWHIRSGSRLSYVSGERLILIQPKVAEMDVTLDVAYNRYMHTPNGRAYIADAISRGITINYAGGPSLYVYLISETFGEIAERISLTEEQVQTILSQEREVLAPGLGFSASLHLEDETIYFTENSGVPPMVRELAVEKCGYQFGGPGDITGAVTGATLVCSWLTEPLYAAEEDLAKLEEILRGAEFGFVGACGYGAKLTLELAGGETLTVFKGTDGCGSLVFGSYGGYFISDQDNAEFWRIFGLHPETKELLDT